MVERLIGYLETSFLPGRSFRDPADFQAELDWWFDHVANVRFHRVIRCRPADRLAEDLAAMLPPPDRRPEISWRFFTPVNPDPSCAWRTIAPASVSRLRLPVSALPFFKASGCRPTR